MKCRQKLHRKCVRAPFGRRLLDEAFDRHRRDPKMPRIGCRTDDCFGCCLHQIDVDSSPYEVEQILDQVEAEGRLEGVVKRAERLVAHGEGGACPLLNKAGKCTVYEIRPLTCAGYHSTSRHACTQGAKAKIPWHETLWVETCIIAGLGMVPVQVLQGHGEKPRHYLFDLLAKLGRIRLEAKEAA